MASPGRSEVQEKLAQIDSYYAVGAFSVLSEMFARVDQEIAQSRKPFVNSHGIIKQKASRDESDL